MDNTSSGAAGEGCRKKSSQASSLTAWRGFKCTQFSNHHCPWQAVSLMRLHRRPAVDVSALASLRKITYPGQGSAGNVCVRSHILKSAAISMRSATASSRFTSLAAPCCVGSSLIHSSILAKSASPANGCTSLRTSTIDIFPSRSCRR